MKNWILALRSLRKKGQHNVMKIVSLAIGLSIGLVLIAKVCFEQSYDTFYPDNERVYQVYEDFSQAGKMDTYNRVSGGTVVFLRNLIPEIETSTRSTLIEDGPFTLTDSQKKLKALFSVADSCMFDVLPRPILAGNPKEVLARPYYAMVSDEVAEQIGGDVVGQTFTIDGYEDAPITIGGVFEAYPNNSSYQADVLVSMPSIGTFTWDGSMNPVGNDRYFGYVKLRENTSVSAIEERMGSIYPQFLPMEELEKAGVEFGLSFRPLADVHKSDANVKRMSYMLGLIAFALIFTAVMNYILIVVSSIVGRSKEIAVRKSYGATERNIYGIIFSETAVHLLISVVLAVLLLLAFRETVTDLTGTTLEALLYAGGAFLAGVCLFVLVVMGAIPGSMFARIPVAAAFRNFRESKRIWKLALLFVQFVAASFLVVLLFIVSRQYERMVNDNPGYNYENLAYTDINVLADTTQRKLAIQELKRLPEVKDVVTAVALPIYGTGGDNVFLPEGGETLFHISDLYYTSGNYMDAMEIPIIAGRNFNRSLGTDEEVMVSRKFAEQMKITAGWDDVVGRAISITSHNENGKTQTICGVYDDIRVGSLVGNDNEPSALFYSPVPLGYLFVRFQQISPEAIRKAESILTAIAPDKDMHLYSYANEMEMLYQDTRKFRDSVLIGGAITVAIVFIGLIGYTTDEVNRRRKEMALRKINGATLSDIIRLFLKDVARMALPAILIGCGIAYIVAQNWQEQYAEKIPLAWYYFAGGGLLVLLVVLSVAAYNVYEAANDNPVNSLKTE